MGTLTHKGYGRIYCETEGDVVRVEAIIQELDQFEHEYLPNGLVVQFSEYPRVIYNGKFSDMDMNKLTAICWAQGVKIWVFDSGHNGWPTIDA